MERLIEAIVDFSETSYDEQTRKFNWTITWKPDGRAQGDFHIIVPEWVKDLESAKKFANSLKLSAVYDVVIYLDGTKKEQFKTIRVEPESVTPPLAE